MTLQTMVWCAQGRVDDAKSEVLGALEIFEQLGVEEDMEESKNLLQEIEQAVKWPTGFKR